MCECKNVEIGSHNNQVTLLAPQWSSKRFVSVDKCLETEILFLWAKGIMTEGSCCGHNQIDPMINVSVESYSLMSAMGYESWTNQFNVVCWKSKSVKRQK